MKNDWYKDNYINLEKEELIERLLRAEKELSLKNTETERLKTSFLSNISHEIRTPMNAIVGFSDLLKDKNIDANERELFLDSILSGSQKLLSVIDNIIEAAQIESNEIMPVNEAFPVNDLLEELYNSFSYSHKMYGKKNILLSLKLIGNSNPFIFSDSKILRKILSNLIDNAFKFTEQGTIEFGYNLVNETDVQFFVFDSGIGIPKEKYNIIFEKFRQIDEGFSKKYTGLGMGLSISKKLVHLLNGTIRIESLSGRGSKIFLLLPNVIQSKKELHNLYICDPVNQPSWLNQIIGTTKPNSFDRNKPDWKLISDRQSFSA
ncbi:MAG: hypothetical protein CVU00_14770 [Bacteroidetes bacterium HGW-Bacteroidetes-17]|jgi:signal transduction histidine kinase|nr:MAG: hypothetical protein CVU00_14770 [Bacteroidetes bacterium HGW-Bacteroidetes-17]